MGTTETAVFLGGVGFSAVAAIAGAMTACDRCGYSTPSCLRALLQVAHGNSALADAPSAATRKALNDLLVRLGLKPAARPEPLAV